MQPVELTLDARLVAVLTMAALLAVMMAHALALQRPERRERRGREMKGIGMTAPARMGALV